MSLDSRDVALLAQSLMVAFDIEQVSHSDSHATDSLTEIGTVYKDPVTGEIFIASDKTLSLS